MNLVLDTHAFLWYVTGDGRLPYMARMAISDSTNNVYFSVVSAWEITVKYQIGKLSLPDDPCRYLPQLRRKHGISSLGIDEETVTFLSTLPSIHRDPFDRMLVCQALRFPSLAA